MKNSDLLHAEYTSESDEQTQGQPRRENEKRHEGRIEGATNEDRRCVIIDTQNHSSPQGVGR